MQDKINSIFSEMTSIFNLLSKEKDRIFYQYESSLQKNENKIRALYSDIFNLIVKKSYLENNMEILLRKEREYRLVKEKTGVVVENGSIVYNDRKENEIFILRTENSTLKNVITKKELSDTLILLFNLPFLYLKILFIFFTFIYFKISLLFLKCFILKYLLYLSVYFNYLNFCNF